MKSTKILTINPFPSGVNQKLVPAKKYNELWDDVHDIETRPVLEPEYVPQNLGITTTELTALFINGFSMQVYQDPSLVPQVGEAEFRLSDFIRSVHYTGTGTVNYSYSSNNGITYSTPVTDPSKEIISMKLGGNNACNNLGTQLFKIKVTDGTLQAIGDCYVILSDNSSVC